VGYWDSTSHSDGSLSVSLSPAAINTQLFSGFVQDEIALIPNRLYVTVGTKLEHNHYTGFGLMPSVRVAYSPSGQRMMWAAISRALRTPAATDASIRLNFAGFSQTEGPPILVGLLGNPHFKNEALIAYEIGYRTAILKRLSIDFSAYYNDYDDQQTTEPAAPFPRDHTASRSSCLAEYVPKSRSRRDARSGDRGALATHRPLGHQPGL
jgi:iron complex outermembrane receptor protein